MNYFHRRDGLMKHLNFSNGYEEQLLNSYVIGRDINYVEEFSNAYIADYLAGRNSNPWMVDFKLQNDIVVNTTSNDTNANETGNFLVYLPNMKEKVILNIQIIYCLVVQEFVSNFKVNPNVKGIIMGVFAADAALRTHLAPKEGSKYYNKNSSFMVKEE